MEYASSVWGSMLTDDLESVQIAALAIIYSNCSFEESLKINKIKTLKERREIVIKKFALKNSRHGIFGSWFKKREIRVATRYPMKYIEVPSRCERWMKSPIPVMTRLLNRK